LRGSGAIEKSESKWVLKILQSKTIIDSEMSVHEIIGSARINESSDVFGVLEFEFNK